MDKKSLIFIAIMWIAMFLIMQHFSHNQQQAPAAPPKLEAAQALDQKADDDQGKLQGALDAYAKVASDNPAPNIQAQARLQIGILQETKLDAVPFALWRWLGIEKVVPGVRQENNAVATYKLLVQDFPPDTSPIGKEAEARLINLEGKINAENSTSWGYQAIDFLVGLTGRHASFSFAAALLMLAIIVKVVTTPLSRKQFESMKEMQKLQPLMKALQEKYKDDKQALGEKTMALYKEHGVNPFASCLPLLVQMPILLGLYWKVILMYQYQFVKGHFLWIGSSLTQSVPPFLMVLHHRVPLIARDFSMPDLPLLLLYAGSMVISQKLTVVDPSQAEQQKLMAWMMPVMFTFILSSFQSALIFYWLMFNVFSTIQQYHIMKPSLAGGPPAPAETTTVAPPPKPPAKKRGSAKGQRKRNFDSLHPEWNRLPLVTD